MNNKKSTTSQKKYKAPMISVEVLMTEDVLSSSDGENRAVGASELKRSTDLISFILNGGH